MDTRKIEAARAESTAMYASIEAARMSGSAKLHEDAATAWRAAANAMRNASRPYDAREADAAAKLESQYAAAIRASQQEETA